MKKVLVFIVLIGMFALGASVITRIANLNGDRYVIAFAGADFGAKATACFADLPAAGGKCIASGITGAQQINSLLTIPKGTTLVLDSAQILCSVAPCIQLADGARLLGKQGVIAYPGTIGPVGSVIWENTTSNTNALIKTASTHCYNCEIGNLSIVNATSLGGSLVANGVGVGLDTTYFVSASIHDLSIQGFDKNLYSSFSYYSHYRSLSLTSFQSAGFYGDNAFSENTLEQVSTMFPGSATAVGLYFNSAALDSVRDIDVENYNNAGQKAIKLVGSSGINISGVAWQESLGGASLFSDDNAGPTSTGFGNTICLSGAGSAGFCQEVNGILLSAGAGNVGFPAVVYQGRINVNSGSSISSTPLYTDPYSGTAAMYEAVFEIGSGGSGTGSTTVLFSYADPLISGASSCGASLDLSTINGITRASCQIYAAAGTAITISSSGGSGAAYSVAVALTRIK